MNYVNLSNRFMKRIVLLTAMAAAGMLMLVGCGSKAPEGYYILDSVTSVSDDNAADCLTAQGLDKSYLVLNGTEGYLVLMGTPEDISYKSETGVISTSFGDIPASVRGDVLTLADKNVVMQFKSSDKPAPAKPAYPTLPEPEPEPEPEVIKEAEEEPEPEEQEEPVPAITEAMDDFWNGYWFGYWTVDPVESVWKDHEGYQFYVLARTGLDKEGNTEIHIWDNDYAVADVYGTNDGGNSPEYGLFISTDGVFWDGDNLSPGEWTINPADSGHADTICITGTCNYDMVPQFNYTIRLVKWGSEWTDYEDDELPGIMSWYRQQLDSGITDPLTLKLPEHY